MLKNMCMPAVKLCIASLTAAKKAELRLSLPAEKAESFGRLTSEETVQKALPKVELH
jgi:hypothetical protein